MWATKRDKYQAAKRLKAGQTVPWKVLSEKNKDGEIQGFRLKIGQYEMNLPAKDATALNLSSDPLLIEVLDCMTM